MSSYNDEWETPQELFDDLNKVWGFELDVCATRYNRKCKLFFDKEQDGLAQEWKGTCWMNPPYAKGIIDRWVAKAVSETRAERCVVVVALLPVRTDTRWWHEHIEGNPDVYVEFHSKRTRFKGAKHNAPFATCIVYFFQPE